MTAKTTKTPKTPKKAAPRTRDWTPTDRTLVALSTRVHAAQDAYRLLLDEIGAAARKRYQDAGGCMRCMGQGRGIHSHHDGDSYAWDCTDCGGIPDPRRNLLRRTGEEAVRAEALKAVCEAAEAAEAAELTCRDCRVGYWVRVFKGRKVPKGEYRCVNKGDGQWGPWIKVEDAAGVQTYIDPANAVGLNECPVCRQHGLSDELLLTRIDAETVCCCVCRDRLLESGEIDG